MSKVKVKVKGRPFFGIYKGDKVFRFDEFGLCTMERAEFEMLKLDRYNRSLKIVEEIKPPNPVPAEIPVTIKHRPATKKTEK